MKLLKTASLRNKKNRVCKFVIIVLSSLFLLCLFFYCENNLITTTNLVYKNNKVPLEFNDFKILHISDLHNKEFGASQKNLIDKTIKINPDVIFITGDLIDSRRTSEDELKIALKYLEAAVKVSPVYYVSGNHEFRSNLYSKLKPELEALGVTVLDNGTKTLTIGESSISILGLSDITFTFKNYRNINIPKDIENKLNTLNLEKENTLSILLSHRPELIDTYAASHIDLVFSGHAHGGQIRVPFIGGIIAPDQGLFPKYTEGLYTYEDTTLVVSRGLGNSLFPLRIFNRPELVVLTLKN